MTCLRSCDMNAIGEAVNLQVVRFMQNEPHLVLYRAQLTNVNIYIYVKNTNKWI